MCSDLLVRAYLHTFIFHTLSKISNVFTYNMCWRGKNEECLCLCFGLKIAAALDFSKTGWYNATPLTRPWSYSSSPHYQCPSGSCTWHDAVTRRCREQFQWTRPQPRTCAHPRAPWTCWWVEPLSLLVLACSGWHTEGRTAIMRMLTPRKTSSGQGSVYAEREAPSACLF